MNRLLCAPLIALIGSLLELVSRKREISFVDYLIATLRFLRWQHERARTWRFQNPACVLKACCRAMPTRFMIVA